MTHFWMIRHALVEENARGYLYGALDVEICPTTVLEQAPIYAALAKRLPQPATWLATPLSRTQRTARLIQQAGYPAQELIIEPGLIEANFGEWQRLTYDVLPQHLTLPAHPFWPVGGHERPPGGESMQDLIGRVGATMERLAKDHTGDVVVVSHGGTIRAAVAHALGIGADNALHLSVSNLSLTRLDHVDGAWRVGCVNEMAGY